MKDHSNSIGTMFSRRTDSLWSMISNGVAVHICSKIASGNEIGHAFQIKLISRGRIEQNIKSIVYDNKQDE